MGLLLQARGQRPLHAPCKDCQGLMQRSTTTILTCMPSDQFETRPAVNVSSLRGHGIELRVGTANSVHNSTEDSMCNTWSLPKRLISHYSPFLEAACLRDFKERRENRIQLPDDDPIVFALFVEWMYYGEYNIAPLLLPVDIGNDRISVHAKCWVLGDKLLCTEFKNHAMSRLYAQHNADIFSRAISTLDVQYACDNSAEDSKLRKLYVDFVATNFEKKDRVQGTVDEWDQLLLSYADVRLLLLHSFRLEASQRSFVKSEDCYLEGDDALL
jgi:hypothetical protein